MQRPDPDRKRGMAAEENSAADERSRPGLEPTEGGVTPVGEGKTSGDPPHRTAVDAPRRDVLPGASAGFLTERHEPSATEGMPRALEALRRFRVTVESGPEPGLCRDSTSDRCSIGSHPLNDLVIADPTVSRFHCEIRIAPEGALVFDLKSRNGTILDGVKVREAFLRGGSVLRLGRVVLRFEFAAQGNRIPVSGRQRFGSLVGASVAMRATFALMERAAQSDVTVLLEGETGTGKGKAAEAIHQESARGKKPFVVIDCSSIHANLLESELFGHEMGAFTGAKGRRVGAFEEANGGTVFLDEVGELPADLQPKLLRVLENRELRRVGANRFIPVDVRVIAATNRDLRAEVNAGRFRSDVYFRLAVLRILMPPLRSRPEDLPAMVEEMLKGHGADEAARSRLLSPGFLAELQRGQWPGNARELRNYLERCLVVPDEWPLEGADVDDAAAVLPFVEAKRRAQAEFERSYLESLLRRFDGKVARAAEVAGVDRVYLYRLLRRHGMKPKL
jgi:two-component system, NtrC family, response regulator GlrR